MQNLAQDFKLLITIMTLVMITERNQLWTTMSGEVVPEWRILSVRDTPSADVRKKIVFLRCVQWLTKTSQNKTHFLSLLSLFVIFVKILKWYSLTSWLTKGRYSVPGQLKNWNGDGGRCQRCYPITTLFHH